MIIHVMDINVRDRIVKQSGEVRLVIQLMKGGSLLAVSQVPHCNVCPG